MNPDHDKVVEDRREAAAEVLQALKDLKCAAGMPEDEEGL